jgi:hypothetical protein
MRATRETAIWLCVAMMTGAGNPLLAQHGTDVSVGLRVSTLGFGLEGAKLLTGHLGVRGGFNYFKVSTHQTKSDIQFDASLKMTAVSLLADFFPSRRGRFHLSTGFVTNPVDIKGTGVPTQSGTFEINHHTYQSSDVGTLNARLKLPGLSPYLGLGFGTPAAQHGAIKFLFDLGVVLGRGRVSLSATGAANNSQLQSDLNAEVADIQDDVHKVPVYPVLGFGLAYRF